MTGCLAVAFPHTSGESSAATLPAVLAIEPQHSCPPVPTAREPRKPLKERWFESNLGSGSQFPEGVLRRLPFSRDTMPGRCVKRERGTGGYSVGTWEPAAGRVATQQKHWKNSPIQAPTRFPRFPRPATSGPAEARSRLSSGRSQAQQTNPT